ncbi:MAG: hypothetical protein ACI8W8_003952 [Rhodothermales bacterium]|jgi:hypothetical protein
MPPFCNHTRREFLAQAGNGFFGTALAGILASDGLAGSSPMTIRQPHFQAKAKACINLFMVGGPSHMDTFDPKPKLKEMHAQDHDFGVDSSITQKPKGKLKGSPFSFAQHGQAGTWVSELYPNLATCVDDMAVIRSMKADSSAHGSASLQMNTGFIRQGHPAIGSWATYGLGSVNQNLPGFVVLVAGAPYSGATNWNNGFMPASYAGTVFDFKDTPITNLSPATGASVTEQRKQLDLLAGLNRLGMQRVADRGDLQAHVDAYELAFRMQSHAPDAVDLDAESEATREAYGIGQSGTDRFGRCCLMARRLVERGVRYVQIFHSNWDTHGDNNNRHRKLCHETDRPMMALINDLKQRGLLDETLVSWGGEFGRTPVGGPDEKGGRDHHATAFSMWMAGGGIKGGVNYGDTDELGFDVAENPMHVHDLHATMLHLMGIDHEKLTFRHNDRNFRLTDVEGEVIGDLLA